MHTVQKYASGQEADIEFMKRQARFASVKTAYHQTSSVSGWYVANMFFHEDMVTVTVMVTGGLVFSKKK